MSWLKSALQDSTNVVGVLCALTVCLYLFPIAPFCAIVSIWRPGFGEELVLPMFIVPIPLYFCYTILVACLVVLLDCCHQIYHFSILLYYRSDVLYNDCTMWFSQQAVPLHRHIKLAFYKTPPFSLWTTQPRRTNWQHRSNVNYCRTSNICERCLRLLKESALLTGSKLIFTWREEWHDLNISLEDLEAEVQPSLWPSSEPLCHFCTILYNSILQKKQQEAHEQAVAKVDSGSSRNNHGISDSSDTEHQCIFPRAPMLRIKVWEDHVWEDLKLEEHTGPNPSHYWDGEYRRYMQLYHQSLLGGYRRYMQSSNLAPLGEKIMLEEGPTTADIDLDCSTESSACMSGAKKWLDECKTMHPDCSPKPSGKTQPIKKSKSYLPSRLVYVGKSIDSSELYLYKTSPEDTNIDYMALSHCWGRTVKYKLTEHTYKEMCTHIGYTDLAPNFQDAVSFARHMGCHYLWIDSLCIIQDCGHKGEYCEEISKKDWDRESRKMSGIYAEADCTISACASKDSTGGCFKKRNPLSYFPCNLLSSDKRSLIIRNGPTNAFVDEVDKGPLSTRSWAFQERLLSKRIVHFGATFMFFECNSLFASELQRDGIYEGLYAVTEDGAKHELSNLLNGKDGDMAASYDILSPAPSLPLRLSVPPLPPPSYPPEPRWRRVTTTRRFSLLHPMTARTTHNPNTELQRDYKRECERIDQRQQALTRRHIRQHNNEYQRECKRVIKEQLAYRPPKIVESESDHSVTGYRGAFNFMRQNTSATPSVQEQFLLHQRWFRLVSKYTRGRLTVPEDRFKAIYGIANAIQGDNNELVYIAGLWSRHLLFDLLWCVEGSPKPRPSRYSVDATSWSWLAVDGEVNQRLLPFTRAELKRKCVPEFLAKARHVAVTKSSTSAVEELDIKKPAAGEDGTAYQLSLIIPVNSPAHSSPAHAAEVTETTLDGNSITCPAPSTITVYRPASASIVSEAELIKDGYIHLTCRVAKVEVVRGSRAPTVLHPSHQWELSLATQLEVKCTFDIKMPSRLPDLFCAVILRIKKYPLSPHLLTEDQIHGIVLKKADKIPAGYDKFACYERVGTFWMDVNLPQDFTSSVRLLEGDPDVQIIIV